MDFDRLRYFHAIARTGSLVKASELLNLSSPALSKAMSMLEAELGRKLFLRVGRGIAITDEGKRVLVQVTRILDEMEKLDEPVVADRGLDSVLRLGSFEVFSTYFLGRLMKQSFSSHRLEIYELIPGEMEAALSEGSIDVGITYLPIPRPDLDYLKVTSLRMGVFAMKGHFSSTTLDKLPFAVPIVPIKGAPTKVHGLDGWPDDKVPRFQKYQVTLMETAMALCREGLAVAYLPTFIVDIHNETAKPSRRLKELQSPEFPLTKQDIYLIKRKSSVEDKTIKRIARAIRLTCRG